jgi:three-Cys-motif partner protein
LFELGQALDHGGHSVTRYHDKFFNQATPQSSTKLRIFRAYLQPWAAKLGSKPRNARLVVVDGFAGRGRYLDGSPGSPEIAMQLARAAVSDARSYRVQCMFGESRQRNQSVLREIIGLYPEASAPLIEDDFWERIDDVQAFVALDPALIFIDPFGLAGLRFDRLVKLVDGMGRNVDLIVNLRTPAAPRLAAELRLKVTQAVGSDDWSVDTVSEVFRRNLAAACNFLPPAPLQIRERLNGRLHTELVLAARAPAAYELWNDEIVKEVERLDASNALGDSERTRDINLGLVAARLHEWSQTQVTWRRQDAVDWYVVRHCGDAHSGTIRRAHESLVNRRFIELNPQANVEDRRFRRI